MIILEYSTQDSKSHDARANGADPLRRYQDVSTKRQRLGARKGDVDECLKQYALDADLYTPEQLSALRDEYHTLRRAIDSLTAEMNGLEGDSVTIRDFITAQWPANDPDGADIKDASRVILHHPAELVAAPISWRIESILPDGMLTVLHARDKLGKTILAWEAARAMLRREAFLGTFAVHPGKVVLALLDDPHDLTVQRRDALGLKDCGDLRIVTPLDADLSDSMAFLAEFKTACEEFKPSLIVLDALYQFAPPGKDSMNDVSRMRGPMGVFNSLAETLHAAVLLIAHDRNDGSDVAGSHVIRASAKALLHLTRPRWSKDQDEEDDGRRILAVVSKMTGEARHLLRCQGVGAWSYLGRGDSAYQARTTWAMDRVLTWLKDGGEGIVPEVAKAAKIRNADALAALTALIEEGLAENELQPRADGKKGKGRLVYRLKPTRPDSGNDSLREVNGNDRSDFLEPAKTAGQSPLPIIPAAENQVGTIGQAEKPTIDGVFDADTNLSFPPIIPNPAIDGLENAGEKLSFPNEKKVGTIGQAKKPNNYGGLNAKQTYRSHIYPLLGENGNRSCRFCHKPDCELTPWGQFCRLSEEDKQRWNEPGFSFVDDGREDSEDIAYAERAAWEDGLDPEKEEREGEIE